LKIRPYRGLVGQISSLRARELSTCASQYSEDLEKAKPKNELLMLSVTGFYSPSCYIYQL